MKEYSSIAELFDNEHNKSIVVECGRLISSQMMLEVKERYANRRYAFLLDTDKGYERESVASYLKLFARFAGNSARLKATLAEFSLEAIAKKRLKECSSAELRLIGFARMSLADAEVCFCERPLSELEPNERRVVLRWVESAAEQGVLFITTIDPLRIATLMPGTAFWYEEGRFVSAEYQDEHDPEEAPVFLGDEVRVVKIPAKGDGATLLFDPREIDFVESVNKANYLSVRGSLYQTSVTMDELEHDLIHFGFFRCHRSYIVNLQKIVRIERYTRNSFNLTLSDAGHSSIPLAKGRAEELRSFYDW